METIITDSQDIEDKIRGIISFIGDNPYREGLLETPKRIIKSWRELFSGYKQDPREVLKKSFSETNGYDEMIILKQIDFFSFCEHHMLPFFGKCSIGYVPKKRVVGISKLGRIVDVYAKRLQIQERMTQEIADVIESELKPRGVMVLVEAQHFCIVSRGVKKENAIMTTSAIKGVFKKKEPRQEFLELIK